MTTQRASYLQRLLTCLEVQVRGFALCKLRRGHQLSFGEMEAPVVHYCLEGTGVLHVSGGPSVSFSQHDLLLVPRGRQCSIAAPNGDLVDHIAGAGDLAMIDDGLVELSAGGGADLIITCGIIDVSYGTGIGLFDAIRDPLTESLRDDEQLRTLMASMVAELSTPRFGTRAVVEALLKQALVLIIRRQLQGDGAHTAWFLPTGDLRLAAALEVMLQRPSDPHTLPSLAAAAGMSRSGFVLRFLAAFGQPPMALLRDLRLRHAARLLQLTELPVEAIAESVGYTSRSYFSRAFRKLFGIDPRSYRALRRQGH